MCRGNWKERGTTVSSSNLDHGGDDDDDDEDDGGDGDDDDDDESERESESESEIEPHQFAPQQTHRLIQKTMSGYHDRTISHKK